MLTMNFANFFDIFIFSSLSSIFYSKMDWLYTQQKTDISALELTYLQTEAVHYYESVDAAAEVIDQAVSSVSAPQVENDNRPKAMPFFRNRFT